MEDGRSFMAVVTMVAWIAVAEAQAAPGGCTTAIGSLSACVKYISGGSDVSNPSQACCNALASVVKTDPTCLCQVLTTNNINQTEALALPRACNVSTPPASQCSKAAGGGGNTTPAPGTRTTPSAAFAVSPPPLLTCTLAVGFVLTKALIGWSFLS